MNYQHLQSTLEKAGVKFEVGLSLQEVHQIELHFHFRFPPDYRDFLMAALPVSRKESARHKGFVNWRNGDEAQILERLSWPYEGMCFDIEYNRFWLPQWGPRPTKLQDALSIAKEAVNQAPTLIPIYAHRYIPSRPEEAGNPVFSVMQMDIIYYGRDLYDYLEHEFGEFFGKPRYQITEPVKVIEFWSDFV